jgi:PAS domain S-box-containing protein
MRRDGSPVDVRVDWAYRKDAMGKVKGFTAIVTDVTERRRALRALRESEEKFRSLAEESPNMIFIESAGRIIYGNRQCETRMGYERASLYSGGIIFDDIVDPGDREAVAAYHRDLHEGRDASPVDCRMTTRGGETFYAIVSSRTIDYHGSRALLTIATDITARREAEEALKESEERYRRLVEESHEIIITMDSAGNLVLANPAFTSVTGWEAEEWLGRPFRELVHPDFRAASDEYFSALRSGEKLPAGEVTLLTRSGESIILEYSSVPIIKDDLFDGAWCIGRDITGRRKAEEDERHLSALREREGVSRWLHDHLGADLYNVILLADSIQRRGNVGSGVREQLGWITDTSRQALASIRNYLDFSGNAAGSFTDLLGSMEEYGASILSPLGIDFTLERRGDLDKVTLTAIQSFNVYLIFKEALTNVVKHSEASRVTALAACEGDVLTITVKDNGRGVARERIGKGYGTMNIRARAEELGATLAIGPLPEGGTRISMSIRAKA